MMKNRLASWTLSHFAVDMSCFYILYKGVETVYRAGNDTWWNFSVAIMVYNCIAFGLQMVLGSIADRHPLVEKAIGAMGLVFMLLPLTIVWIFRTETASWIALILCALLNAAFHVGGGMDVLKNSYGKIAPSGIFVSSGALGVLTGTLLGKAGFHALLPVAIVAMTTVILYLESSKNKVHHPVRHPSDFMPLRFGVGLSVAFLFIAVFIRSYAGIVWPLGFDKTGWLVLLPAVASFFGKALGGIVADKMGAMETAILSLTLSIGLFVIGMGSWWIMGLAILLFNMAMPITLCGLAAAMPNHLGFAFGLSTFALLLGYLAYKAVAVTHPSAIVITLGVIAIVLIAFTIKRKTNKNSIQHVD